MNFVGISKDLQGFIGVLQDLQEFEKVYMSSKGFAKVKRMVHQQKWQINITKIYWLFLLRSNIGILNQRTVTGQKHYE